MTTRLSLLIESVRLAGNSPVGFTFNLKIFSFQFICFLFALSISAVSQTTDQLIVIEQVIYSGNFDIDQGEMNQAGGLKNGMSISSAQLRLSVDLIQQFLQNKGFLYAIIDSARIIQNDKKSGNINIWGRSGRPVKIGDYTIKSDSLKEDFFADIIYLKKGNPYSQEYIEKQIDYILDFLADAGYLFAEVEIDSLVFYEEENYMAGFDLKVKCNQQARLRGVILQGNFYTHDHILLREIGIQTGEVCTMEKINQIPRLLMRLGIFKEVSPPEILWEGDSKIQLKISVKEGNATTFDGVVGYIPERSGDGYFTGRIDLAFRNLFGANRKFDVFWEKPEQLSEEFHISYTEPWVFNYPLSIKAGLDRVVRDTTFVEWAFLLEGSMRLFGDFSAHTGIYRNSVFPDSAASRDMRLLRNAVLNIFAGMEMDNRDNPVNPRAGAFFRINFSYGFKTNYGPSYLFTEDNVAPRERVQSYELRFDWFNHLWSNQVLAIKLNGWQIEGDRIQLTDFRWFGGYRSVRGYREQQFRSDRVAWTNLEYRFLTGMNSRLFAFCDIGYYRNHELEEALDDWLMGYGAGVRLETGLGILGVDFGLGKGDTFAEGKIHFGIINKF